MSISNVPSGQRVAAELPDGSTVTGTVEAIGPRGHKVVTDDGRIKWVAWWRICKAGSEVDAVSHDAGER